MKKNQQPTNSSILDTDPGPVSFIVGSWEDADTFYAAIPCGNMIAIVHKCQIIKKCRTTQSARNFISKHQKRRK
tara:strand:+ start:608 stop:829 length:222 start_codon:yes stop_codon:yes gene_type:complete